MRRRRAGGRAARAARAEGSDEEEVRWHRLTSGGSSGNTLCWRLATQRSLAHPGWEAFVCGSLAAGSCGRAAQAPIQHASVLRAARLLGLLLSRRPAALQR